LGLIAHPLAEFELRIHYEPLHGIGREVLLHPALQ
jgi:hypothetical protein